MIILLDEFKLGDICDYHSVYSVMISEETIALLIEFRQRPNMGKGNQSCFKVTKFGHKQYNK